MIASQITKHLILTLSIILCNMLLCFNAFAAEADTNNQIRTELLRLSLKSESKLLSKTAQEILSGSTISNKDLLPVYRIILNNKFIDRESKSEFLNLHIQKPTNSNYVDLEYVKIKWLEIGDYRNANRLKIANKLQKELSDYIYSIEVKNDDYERALIYLNSHDIVIKIIEFNAEVGLPLAEAAESKARELKDTNLIIISLYYQTEFIILQGDLDLYIRKSEECYFLDSVRNEKSDFYSSNIMHLIDAYIYEGEHRSRSLYLLDLLFKNPSTRPDSYAFYAKFLATIDTNDPIADSIFKKANADNIVDFYINSDRICKDVLYPNDYYHFHREFAYALIHFQEYEMGVEAMEIATSITRKNYSQELSQELANNEKRIIEAEKNAELKFQKSISNIYLYFLLTIGALVVFLIVLLIRKIRQNKTLADSYETIREKEMEKALLMKELHHRVKNNFQVIVGLLSIQLRNIKDEDVRSLVKDSQSRISSMALAHQKLYRNNDFQYSLTDYINSLHLDISNIYPNTRSDLNATIDPRIKIDIEFAIPLGLILNELITNSIKYGKINNEVHIIINIQLEDGDMIINFGDSGNGIPHFESFETVDTMGLKLINRLTRQLQGKVEYKRRLFTFTLPLKEED